MSKTRISNLPSLGYHPSDKAEGIALLPDGSFGILNDNDFAYDYKKNQLLKTPEVFGILSFPAGNRIDVIKDKAYKPKNQPIYGLYQPDSIFIASGDSPNGKPLLVVCNEVSGSTTIYQVNMR